MITIEQLKEKKEFVVEEIDSFSPKMVVLSSYIFSYDKKEEKLYVTGDVFGSEKHRVINSLEVLFNIAKRNDVNANLDKKMNLKLSNIKVIL